MFSFQAHCEKRTKTKDADFPNPTRGEAGFWRGASDLVPDRGVRPPLTFFDHSDLIAGWKGKSRRNWDQFEGMGGENVDLLMHHDGGVDKSDNRWLEMVDWVRQVYGDCLFFNGRIYEIDLV